MYVNSDFVNIGAFIVYFDQGNNIYRIHKDLPIAILPALLKITLNKFLVMNYRIDSLYASGRRRTPHSDALCP